MTDPAQLTALRNLPRAEFFTLYGEVIYLFARNQLHRAYTLAELEQRVLQPIGRNQYRIYRRATGPVALLTWAFLSDALHERMHSEVVDLQPEDWESGPHLWYTDFIAPFGHGAMVIDDMLTNIFPDKVGMAQRAKLSIDKSFVLRTYYGKQINRHEYRNSAVSTKRKA